MSSQKSPKHGTKETAEIASNDITETEKPKAPPWHHQVERSAQTEQHTDTEEPATTSKQKDEAERNSDSTAKIAKSTKTATKAGHASEPHHKRTIAEVPKTQPKEAKRHKTAAMAEHHDKENR